MSFYSPGRNMPSQRSEPQSSAPDDAHVNSPSMEVLENFGRKRLSPNFFMRDFLYSETAALAGLVNYPVNPSKAIDVGKRLCTKLLEPLQATFGRLEIRSAY